MEWYVQKYGRPEQFFPEIDSVVVVVETGGRTFSHPSV